MRNGGDKLASGGIKATFGPVEKVSDQKWAAAFEDLDLERFNGVPNESSHEAAVESDDTVEGNARLREVVKK
jgi:hypothetical protein